MDWGEFWRAAWPVLREMLIAGLVALLALLGYDQLIPSRYKRYLDWQEQHKDMLEGDDR